jgi:NADPH2:quinone reductase
LTSIDAVPEHCVVGQVFAFEDFREAFKTITTRATMGKMVVQIG